MTKKKSLAKRKKPTPHKGQFTKENPPPTVFQPGVSGNPSGTSKAREDRLFSRAIGEQAGYRAPDADAKAVGLGRGASNAQVAAGRVWQLARGGDIPAQRLILDSTEPKNGGVNIGIAIGADGQPVSTEGPHIHVHFIESDGEGYLSAEAINTYLKLGEPLPMQHVNPNGVKESPFPRLPSLASKRFSRAEIDASTMLQMYESSGSVVCSDDLDSEPEPPTIEDELLGPCG